MSNLTNAVLLEKEVRSSSGHLAPARIPAYLYATVFSSLCVILGLIWDICWHMSIGRDGLLSPPHLIIYLGAIVSGLFSGFEILRITFWGSVLEKMKSVKVWGFFYSSLGALFCVWGALSMLTSAPFDDWWHNTYGLDVTILSPPHTVLIAGILSVQFGAIVSSISIRNQLVKRESIRGERTGIITYALFVLSAGFLLTMWYTLLSEELKYRQSHHSDYYKIASMAFPVFLIAFGQAVKGKWTITLISTVYSLVLLLTLWIIPLFPAEPKLGPILHHFDHYQGFSFPLLFVVPAFVLDLLRHRFSHWGILKSGVLLGTAFLAVFFVVQWYMGAFQLESVYARNWFFGSHYWYFGSDPDWQYRYKFSSGSVESGIDLMKGLGIALVYSILSSLIGLKWGSWMNKIQR